MPDTHPKSGIDLISEFIDGKGRSPMHELLGIQLKEVRPGYARQTAMPAEKFYNPWQRVHGGFAASLIDSTLGASAYTTLGAGDLCGTVELNVSYVRKIDASTGELTCEANVLHAGRTMITAEAKITGPDGKLYAHGTGTFLVYPK
jgi:acyl-CoA thioesterase